MHFNFTKECNAASSAYSDVGKQDAWIDNAKDVVKSMLKDGDSAKFKDVYFNHAVLQGKDIPVVCGKVNSKNSFAGYNGFQRFISTGSAMTILEEQMKQSEFLKTWKVLCSK